MESVEVACPALSVYEESWQRKSQREGVTQSSKSFSFTYIKKRKSQKQNKQDHKRVGGGRIKKATQALLQNEKK